MIMDKIEWTEALAVGDEMIDEQHKELIQKLNDLSKALEEHKEGALVMKTLDFLNWFSAQTDAFRKYAQR